MKELIKSVVIKPIFDTRHLFVGVLRFENHESGLYLMLLPALGFVIKWGITAESLERDLGRIDWSK